MTAKRGVYTKEIRAEVVSRLLTGDSVRYVADQMNIPYGTINTWKKRYIVDGEVVRDYQRFPPSNIINQPVPTLEEIQGLILINLQKEIEVKNLIANRILNDSDWLKEQSAQDIAILYGVISDKNDRTLQKITDAQNV